MLLTLKDYAEAQYLRFNLLPIIRSATSETLDRLALELKIREVIQADPKLCTQLEVAAHLAAHEATDC